MQRAFVFLMVFLALCGAAFALGLKCPDCEVRAGTKGAPAIVIDDTPYSPILFMGNNQFGRDEILCEEIRLAAEAGVNLFSFNLWLDPISSPDKRAQTVDRFCAANPSGYFYVRVWMGLGSEWARSHPDECITKADGTVTEWASPAGAVWRETASKNLRGLVREIVEGPHGGRFIGICLTFLQTGEWFYPDTDDFMDYSAANLHAFRVWLKATYQKESRLRKAWNQLDVTFETARIPTPEERQRSALGPFRSLRANRSAIDFQQFQSELVVDSISQFASVVKRATDRRSLVGAFYGYTLDLNGNGPRAIAHSGHLALAKLLECKDIDIIHAPHSYYERRIGQPGHLHLPVDSLALHGKLGIFEDDTYTHLSREPEAGLIAPGWADRTTTFDETLAVNRRNFGNFFTHGAGMWIFDLLSDGRWNSGQFWRSAVVLRRIAAEQRGMPPFQPQVAFLVDEESVNLMRSDTYPYLLESLYRWRAEVDRIGAPVGYYLQSDLPRLPDSIRVMILANAFHIKPEESRAITSHLKQGKTVIWTYAPGICASGEADPGRIGKTMGIQIESKSETLPFRIVIEKTGEEYAFEDEEWTPRFAVTDPDVEVLGKYKDTGDVSVAAKPVLGGVSVYTATPRLSIGILLLICERSGVHLYRNTSGMTAIVGSYLIVHTDDAGRHEFRWPKSCREVERLAPNPNQVMVKDSDSWSDTLPEHCTAIYCCQ